MEYILNSSDGKRYVITVNQDFDVENPREVNEGYKSHLVIEKRGYFFSDYKRKEFKSLDEVIEHFSKGKKKSVHTWADLVDVAYEKGYILSPVWGYSHSGYSFSASLQNPFDRWDSGLVGFIWCKKSDKQNCDFQSEIAEFTHYFNGDVYYMIVEGDEEPFSIGSIYPDGEKPFSLQLEKLLSEYGFEGRLEVTE